MLFDRALAAQVQKKEIERLNAARAEVPIFIVVCCQSSHCLAWLGLQGNRSSNFIGKAITRSQLMSHGRLECHQQENEGIRSERESWRCRERDLQAEAEADSCRVRRWVSDLSH